MTNDIREVGLKQVRLETVILELCHKRGVGKTICPSEAARIIAGEDVDWRSWMDDVRAAGARLSDCGRIEITQKGQLVDPETAKGPIRFGLPRG